MPMLDLLSILEGYHSQSKEQARAQVSADLYISSNM